MSEMPNPMFKDIVSLSSGTMATLASELGLNMARYKSLDALNYSFYRWTAEYLKTNRGQHVTKWQEAWQAYVADMQKI